MSFQAAFLLLAPTILGNHRVAGQSSGASFNISDLIDGTNGIAYNGIDGADFAGTAVSSAGDINGDGVKDLIISAPPADANRVRDAGQVYVIFGSNVTPIPSASFDLDSLDGTDGFAINGMNQRDTIGYSLASGCDINHDGIDDLIIGAPYADANGFSDAGLVHVVFGSNSTPTPWGQWFNLSSLNGNNGFTLNGTGEKDYTGGSLSCDGDVNGDGVDDLIIGARGASRVYMLWGSEAVGSSPFNLTNLDETIGIVLDGNQEGLNLGNAVSSGGDVNGDGVNDIVLGSPYADLNGTNNVGQVRVLFGSNTTSSSWFNISNLNGTNGFTMNGIGQDDYTGCTLTSDGDVDGDGISDLVIATASPKAFVVLGAKGTWAPQFNLSDLEKADGFIIGEIVTFLDTCPSVASGGDVNGDNIDDIVIGTPFADPFGTNRGAVHVVYGRPSSTWTKNVRLSDLNGDNGFTLNGIENFDLAGSSVSLGGDVNGDNVTDIVIGAPEADPNGDLSGQVYVVYGQFPPTPSPTTQAPSMTPLPTTEAPSTPLPSSQGPTTPLPTTTAPSTPLPTTPVPSTQDPTTKAPSAPVPTSEGPTTPMPTTQDPTTPIPSSPSAPTGECRLRQCCEAECCGNRTSWSPHFGCRRNTSSSGWDGTPLAHPIGCAIRVCCESDCCGLQTWYNAAEAACVTR